MPSPQNYVNTSAVLAMISKELNVDKKQVEALSMAVSPVIDAGRGRRVVAPADPETRYFTALDSECLIIDDIATLDGVTVSVDSNRDRSWGTTWEAETEFYFDNEPPVSLLFSLAPYSWPLHRQGVKITARFGYATEVPESITAAANLITYRLFKRPETIFGVSGSPVRGITTIINKVMQDSDIQMLLGVVPYLDSTWRPS